MTILNLGRSVGKNKQIIAQALYLDLKTLDNVNTVGNRRQKEKKVKLSS